MPIQLRGAHGGLPLLILREVQPTPMKLGECLFLRTPAFVDRTNDHGVGGDLSHGRQARLCTPGMTVPSSQRALLHGCAFH
jgi:hypothetical protein